MFKLSADTIDGGSSFHSEMVLGKNEYLYAVDIDDGSWKQLSCNFWCLEIIF